jgi:hypothetical protein
MGRLEWRELKSLRKMCVDTRANIMDFRGNETPAREIGLRLVGADQPYRLGGPSGFGYDEKTGKGSCGGGEKRRKMPSRSKWPLGVYRKYNFMADFAKELFP